MPALLGLGFPEILHGYTKEESDRAKVELMSRLREAVASIEVLRIIPEEVSISLAQNWDGEGLGKELIIQITDLDETLERTSAVLYELS